MKLTQIIKYILDNWRTRSCREANGGKKHAPSIFLTGDFTEYDLAALRNWALTYCPEREGSLHGCEHWDKVAWFGRQLSRQSEADLTVVLTFAYLHDVERYNDTDDAQHGPRTAKLVDSLRNGLLQKLSQEQINLLKEACSKHTSTIKTGNRTVDICFDAHRLDLPRCGIRVNPRLLATKQARSYMKIHSDIV